MLGAFWVVVLSVGALGVVWAGDESGPLMYSIGSVPRVFVDGRPAGKWRKADDFAPNFPHYVLQLPTAGFAQLVLGPPGAKDAPRVEPGSDFEVFAVLRPGVAFQLVEEQGVSPIRSIPGPRCALIPKAQGFRWFKCESEEELPIGVPVPLEDCPRPAYDARLFIRAEGQDGSRHVISFWDTAPGLYRFEFKNGRVIGAFDSKFSCFDVRRPHSVESDGGVGSVPDGARAAPARPEVADGG